MARYIEKIIASSDTLQSIAQQELEDMHRWAEIALFNNLKYPYIVDTVSEKMENPDHLKTIGDTVLIRVPSDQFRDTSLELDRMSSSEKEDIYGLALGKDLSIVPSQAEVRHRGSSDFIFNLTSDLRGGVKTTSGVSNLKQALLTRLLTPRGSYIGHPEFGSNIHMYLGNKNNSETADLIGLEVERVLRTDGRVRHIEPNGYQITGNTYTGAFIVTPVSIEEAFDFVVSMEHQGPITLLDSM